MTSFKRIALVRINGPFDNVGNRQAKQSSEEQPPFNSPLREWGMPAGC
jgi:hypothetical protein